MTGLAPKSPPLELLVDAGTRSWVARFDGEWWLLGDRTSALTLCGYCEMAPDEANFSSAREACIGRLFVRDEGSSATCTLRFLDWQGRQAREDAALAATHSNLTIASWTYGAHDDGWLDVSSALHVEGANHLAVNLYLPEGGASVDETKGVDFIIDGTLRKTVRINRGAINSIEVHFDEPPLGPALIQIEAEYAEPQAQGNDQRLLGCLVTGLSLNKVTFSQKEL